MLDLQNVAIPVTFRDLQDHSPIASLFKWDYFRTVAQQLT